MNSEKILILNTGGTFNKVYNQLTGNLDVPKNNKAIKKILSTSKVSKKLIHLDGIIFKDSLEMNKKDKEEIVKYINKNNFKKILIVHGTDTIDKTANFLSKTINDKQIILTAAMVPFSIDSTEATANLLMSYGFLQANNQNGIFIGMHGLVKKHNKIKKNKTLGVFECQ